MQSQPLSRAQAVLCCVPNSSSPTQIPRNRTSVGWDSCNRALLKHRCYQDLAQWSIWKLPLHHCQCKYRTTPAIGCRGAPEGGGRGGCNKSAHTAPSGWHLSPCLKDTRMVKQAHVCAGTGVLPRPVGAAGGRCGRDCHQLCGLRPPAQVTPGVRISPCTDQVSKHSHAPDPLYPLSLYVYCTHAAISIRPSGLGAHTLRACAAGQRCKMCCWLSGCWLSGCRPIPAAAVQLSDTVRRRGKGHLELGFQRHSQARVQQGGARAMSGRRRHSVAFAMVRTLRSALTDCAGRLDSKESTITYKGNTGTHI